MDTDGSLATTADQQKKWFVHDGSQIALQFEAAGTGPTALTHRYFWGLGVDQLLADEKVSGTSTGVYWALTDHLGTVRDLIDSTGTIRKHTAYDSFGQVVSEEAFTAAGVSLPAADPAAVDSLFGYTGRAFDDATGLQNNLNRWYDAKLGRWTSEDPIGFGGGDANLYRYVGNGSTEAVDPSGLKDEYTGPSIGAAVPWYTEVWWRFKNRESLVLDPRDPANGGAGDWVIGNLYHRSGLGDVAAAGLRFGYDPFGETCAQANDLGTAIVNLPSLPEIWEATPDYQKQDIVIQTLTGSYLGSVSTTVLRPVHFPTGVGYGMLTPAESVEIQLIAKKHNTVIDVVGSRAAGKGRNVETGFTVGKDIPGCPPTRSDIDFRIDTQHPFVEDLISDLRRVGGGAGRASTKFGTDHRPTYPPFIRFTPGDR